MKIGLISDFHFGHKKVNIQTLQRILSHLISIEHVSIIVDCGDILDTDVLNSVQAEQLRQTFKNMSVPYHIVRGNHDSLGDVSLATILSLNDNIFVHNDICVTETNNCRLLFVPYYNSIKQLYKDLQNNVSDFCDFAFSHLNITNNFYATIPLDSKNKNLTQLFKYSENWFNGHIHTPETYESIEGNIYNIGSISSLTFGDSHFPCYYILDTETKNLSEYPVVDANYHKTLDLSQYSTEAEIEDSFLSLCDNIINLCKDTNVMLFWRVYLPTFVSLEFKQNLKSKLLTICNCGDVIFSFKQSNSNKKEKIEESINNKNSSSRENIVQQFINSYEKNTQDKILDSIITKLM